MAAEGLRHPLLAFLLTVCAAVGAGEAVAEAARELPVAARVDVVVVGGSTGAVAAAVAAAESGAEVFLVAPKSYLGDDVCATKRLWLDDDALPDDPLVAELFAAEGGRPRGPVRPLRIKRILDEALLAAGVRFLLNSYPAGVLVDDGDRPAGIAMVNFSGRQAVVARTLVDATPRSAVAEAAGAASAPYPAGPQTFSRVVIGGGLREGPGVVGRTTGLTMPAKGGPQPIHEYRLTLDMPSGSWAAFQAAEQAARDLTFHPGQLDASEELFQVPPDPLRARTAVGRDDPDWDAVDLDAFRPAGVERLFVLGGRAAISRPAARRLLTPPGLVAVGRRLGRAAAAAAAAAAAPRGVHLPGRESDDRVAAGEVHEIGNRNRFPLTGDTVPAAAGSIPVLARREVVVIGGGTGGAPAGIGGGRGGAETLVVEWLHALGGVGTLGLIGKYYHGYRKGFTAEVDRGVSALGAAAKPVGKAEYWRRANREAGTDIWLRSLGCGALVEDGRIRGAVVATPQGRGVVLAEVIVDATGKADIAAAAGAETRFVSGGHLGMQGAGLPPVALGAGYTNTDYMFADDTDVVDLWHLFVYARRKFARAYDLGQLVDTRERRRIVGEVTLSPMDMLRGRTWRDTISVHRSNFDSHGFTVHPLFLLRPPDRRQLTVHVPLRALLPAGLRGLLVIGLGASAHRDALPVIRMQPCVQNQGYAVGLVAAAAVRAGRTPRRVDLRPVRRHLVDTGCLPEAVLEHRDQPPPDDRRLAAAVAHLGDGYRELELVLARPAAALPLLRRAHADSEDERTRLIYAHVLGMLGDPAGADTLLRAVEAHVAWDEGWNYRGMGQYGRSMSDLDSYLVALGRSAGPAGLEAILEKARALDAGAAFSHHRACALALEALAGRLPDAGRQRAAAVLAAVLARPKMTGHVTTDLAAAQAQAGGGSRATGARNRSLRELVLARALYRLGDHEGGGEAILRDYARDLRGIYSRHARAVLAGR